MQIRAMRNRASRGMTVVVIFILEEHPVLMLQHSTILTETERKIFPHNLTI